MIKTLRVICLLLALIMPVSLCAKVISSGDYNGIIYTNESVSDSLVDSIFYTSQDSLLFEILSKEKKTAILAGHKNQNIINIPPTISYNERDYDVVAIKDGAFIGCQNLISVNIPSSVETIGAAAFANCSNLKRVTLPPSLSVIERSLFRGCTSLECISLPEKLKIIEEDAFEDCANIKSLHIPESVESIGLYAFGRCKGLTMISIPNVSYIDCYAFLGCENIDSLYWNTPNVSPSIVSGYCRNKLKYVCFGDEIREIDEMAFWSCRELSSITIPKNVEYIGGTFDWCDNLKEVVIEGSPLIDNNAFGCSEGIESVILKSQTPPQGVGILFSETVYKNAVLSVPWSSHDEYMATYPWYKFQTVNKVYDSDYESDPEADSINYNIQEDTIYSIVQEDGDTIYYGIQEEGDTIYYTVNDDGAYVAARAICRDGFYSRYGFDGPLTPRDPITGGQQPRSIRRSMSESPEVDSSYYTFYRGSIAIPESLLFNDSLYTVKGINYYAFVGCKELESVSIPESVRNLGYGSFAGCSGLSMVNIPSYVNEIPDALFYGCSSLGSIEIPSVVLTIGHSAFYGCSGLAEITIPAGVELIDEYAFAYCTGLKRVVIEGNPVIAETAFIGCGTELEVIRGREDNDGERDSDGGVKSHYSIEGLRISDDTPGIHIIKYRNGTVRKALVR